MATGGHNEVGWNLVHVGNLKLEPPNKRPNYISIVICQNKIIVLDFEDHKVKIHRLHDGKFLDMLDSNSRPCAICLMDATTICVLHRDGLIEMVSIKSEDMSPVFTRMKSFRLDGVFDRYQSVVRVNDNIVVVGVKQDTTYWCITSLDDGHVDTIHRICKESIWSYVTTKDNIIYISCHASDNDDDDNGVYAFDILNPSQCKYRYKHQRLEDPRSIVINEDGNIFVGNGYFYLIGILLGKGSCIHQLTASCQLVAIFTQGIPRDLQAMFWDNGRLYVTRWGSHDITVFRHVYQGSHKASEVLVSDEGKQPGIEELAKQKAQGNVDNGQSSVETEMPPSGLSHEDSEDKKRENHTDSEVPISDEGKELVIEGTSTQIGQEIIDNGQSSVEIEMPPSRPSSEDSEDEKQENHTDSEVPISDEGKELVIEGTSTQIGQEIIDNGQSSVEIEMPPSRPSSEDSEDEKQENHTDSEVPISDEGKELVIEETSTQIGQEIIDNGQSSVEIEMPPSRPSSEDSEDEKQENHTDSEVPISDEGKELVIVGASTQIGQEIIDDGQSSVEIEMPPSRPSSEDSEDEKQENHTDSEVPISDEGKELVIVGASTQIGQEIIDNGQSSVEIEMPPSRPSSEDSEDEKQENHTDSEVPISDEGKELVIVGASTQIGQEIIDNGQSSVEIEMPPSRPSSEDSEDEKQENHTDSEVPISDEGKELVIVGASTQIGQEIMDNGQSSVEIEMPPSRPSSEDSEDEKQENHTDSEVPISDEGKELVIVGASTQIGQEIIDNGQSSVEIKMPPSRPSSEDSEDEKQENHTDSEVPISDEGKELVIEGTSTQIGQEIIDNGQSSGETEMPPSGPSPEESANEKHGHHTDSEVPIIDDGRQPVIEGTSTPIGQEIAIQQSVVENLKQAGIKMSTEKLDLFIEFQNEIGTDIYFSKGQHRLINGHGTLKATEIFIEQRRPDMKDKWLEYKSQGKLAPELINVIYAEERNQELHENKDYFLNTMEQLNIIVKARAFNENGVKEENYFFTPCMLREESPREVISPEKDARVVSTSVLCWVIKGTSILLETFQKLIAACLDRWPVAKKKNTSESLIFQNCTVFDLDLVHRLFLHFENHAVFARITEMGFDHVNAKLCTRVRKFITLNLLHHYPNSEYQLCVQTIEAQDIPENSGSHISPPIQMWLADEVHDPTAPITREHINHSRLSVAIIAICGNAMRTILLANPPAPHKTIYKAIRANKTKLIGQITNQPGKRSKGLLNNDQREMLFPDPKRRYVASIDQLDISLLYSLIKNITTLEPLSTDWGIVPQDRPRDMSLGANVERIHMYRNKIFHSADGQISQQEFEDYWNKIESVLQDIDTIAGQAFSQELEMQRRQVISVYEAC